MSSQDRSDAQIEGNDILITRVFDAPRERVWKAWTEPEHIARWFGPRGFDTTVEEQNFRPGGASRYVMHGPDGKDYPCRGVFREIEPMRRIVTTDEFGEGFEQAMDVDLPQGIVLTVLFEDLEGAPGKTRLTLRIAHPTEADRKKHEGMGVVGGWQSSFECLDELLEALRAA